MLAFKWERATASRELYKLGLSSLLFRLTSPSFDLFSPISILTPLPVLLFSHYPGLFANWLAVRTCRILRDTESSLTSKNLPSLQCESPETSPNLRGSLLSWTQRNMLEALQRTPRPWSCLRAVGSTNSALASTATGFVLELLRKVQSVEKKAALRYR